MVSEKMVLLKGAYQEIVTKTVDIKGELEEPLKLEPIEFTLDKKAKFNIEEVTKGKHFRVTFTSIPNVGNSYRGILKLKTNYPEKPELVIYVMGKFSILRFAFFFLLRQASQLHEVSWIFWDSASSEPGVLADTPHLLERWLSLKS